ncbi:hypothetical protein V9T40_012984 [Parthenolecanium corni]|uniref:Amino acid transporter transmembrane domain-containing protein n=1 Tax=Parthenolecanium corni TaxID=536013 RepID=A0AAN9TC36_9HEMI
MVGVRDSFKNDSDSENKGNGYSNAGFNGDTSPPPFATIIPSRTEHVNEKDKVTFHKSHHTEPQLMMTVQTSGNYPPKDYEPYDYCTSEKPTSYFDTFFHLLKAAVGTGILAIPSAYKDAGYAVGVGGVLFMAFLYTYCMHLLVASEHELSKRRRVPNLSYANTVGAAFEDRLPKKPWLATSGQFFANFFFMVYESGGCAIYIIFISKNLKQLLDHYLDQDVNLTTIMIGVTIPLILVCWIRNLKLLAPFSAAANFIIVVCFALVFYYVFREAPSFEHRRAIGSPAKLPVYLTTVIFAIACTGLIIPLKQEMKKPAQFGKLTGVLNMAMIPMTILYAIFGFFGYLKYGDDVQGSITLNLPQNEGLAQAIKGLYSLSVFISYHLCYYVVLDIVWKSYLKDKVEHNQVLWEYVIRTIIPIVTLLMAIAIPNLEVFISLVGALGISTTSLVLPVIVHTLTFWDQQHTKVGFYRFIIRNGILFAMSMLIFLTGIFESVQDVMRLYKI